MEPLKAGSVSPLHDPPESQSPPLPNVNYQCYLVERASGGVELVSSIILFSIIMMWITAIGFLFLLHRHDPQYYY